jgi:hypothetical protein
MPSNQATVETLIADAEDLILSAIPTIQTQIDDSTTPLSRVVRVVCQMIIRHLRNPMGQRSVSETRGPNNMSVTFGGNDPGALYLSDEERRDLMPATTQGSRKAFSIDPAPNALVPTDPNWWFTG